LIGVDGYIRLCDFGMVHYLENENSKTDELCGTADYFAPEMHRGGGYNFSVDYWTLGCMIYDLICEEPPVRLQFDPRPPGL
jgi:serine/threonine protein kinase